MILVDLNYIFLFIFGGMLKFVYYMYLNEKVDLIKGFFN